MSKLYLVVFISAFLLVGCASGQGNEPPPDTTSPEVFDTVAELPTDANSDATTPLPDPDILLDTGPEVPDQPEPVALWDLGPEVPDLPPWVIKHLGEEGLSNWSFALEHGGEPPAHMHLADYAVANGHVFSLIGYASPFNTLHSMIGPDYQKDDGYFSDLWIEVASAADGNSFTWKREWIGRAHGAPVVVTHAESPVVSLTVLDVARFGGLSYPEDSPPGILRVVLLRNRTAEDLDGLWLRAACARSQEDLGEGQVQEERGGNRRILEWLDGDGWLDGDEPVATGTGLAIPVGPLPAGGLATLRLAAGTGEDGDDIDATIDALREEAGPLIEDTLTAWGKRLYRGIEVVTPDSRINDYLTGAQVIVLSQIASTGALCPMSQYTRTWLRDCGGPVRYLARSGFTEEAEGILDYLWLAALVEGGLRNSYPADLDPDLLETLDPPAWEDQPVMTGRTRAESPSYLVLMYAWLFGVTGHGPDYDQLQMLRHALLKQEFHGDLLPFSGDETFRTAMAIAHGLPVDESFEEGYLSANSSFLWVPAARFMALISVLSGEDVEVYHEWLALAAQVEAAAEETYHADGGAYTPYVHEEDLSPAPAPFEDVNTKPIWAGYLERFSDAAADNLDATIAALGGGDGILVSPLPDAYVGWMGLPIEEGIYTGMSPGYFLQNLAQERHPLAEAAFNALQHHASPSGATPEYAVLDGPYPLQLMYDPTGGEPADYASRYRPWEGAIVADAALEYLFGLRQVDGSFDLALSPNLPNGWSWSEAQGVQVGDSQRYDIRVERHDGTWTVTVTALWGGPVNVSLDLPWPDDGADAAVTLDGVPIEAHGWVNRWGQGILQVENFSLVNEKERVIVAR